MVTKVSPHVSPTVSDDFTQHAKAMLLKWTPRLLVATFAGYYCLGMLYDYGVLAAIDKVAIVVVKHFVGYAGVGAAMPTIQWYCAWGARMAVAAAAGIGYDITERFALYVYHKIRHHYYPASPPPSSSAAASAWIPA